MDFEKIRTNPGYARSGLRFYNPTREEDVEIRNLIEPSSRNLLCYVKCHLATVPDTVDSRFSNECPNGRIGRNKDWGS